MRRVAWVAVIALSVAAAVAFGAEPARATDDFTISRLAGGDRVSTAATIAVESFPAPAGAQTVVIAREDTFPDALAGNYSAGLLGAPMLLTSPTALSGATRTAITALGARAAVVLGGTIAIAESVADELRAMGLVVSRVAGPDRFATAAQLALAAGPAAVGRNERSLRTAVLSSGLNFPDALAAGPMVYRQHFPQLLTGTGALPPVTRQALLDLGIQHVIITGGAVAVPAGMETELAQMGITSVERIAGTTRYTTALALASKATAAFEFSANHIDFATGENFPDALAGGPHGGRSLSPILLVPSATSGADFDAVCDTLQFVSPVVAVGHAFGGPGAISDASLTAITACGRPVPPVVNAGQVVRVSVGANQYTFVDADDETVRVVTYDGLDRYVVDGATVTESTFEANLSPGDQVSYADDVTRVNRDTHTLTNRVVTEGLVGNVNTTPTARTLEIINPVTGDRVGGPYAWAEAGDTLLVDNGAATVAVFEGSLNEGDLIDIDLEADTANPTRLALTNGTVTGTVTSRSASDSSFATFDVDDIFGDEPEGSQDAVFRAQATPTVGVETYRVDGAPALNFLQFAVALSVGDTITVGRSVVGGVPTETFDLTNVTPVAFSGQVSSFINTAEDPSAADPSGDRVVIVPAAGGYRNVDYTSTPPLGFRVDGSFVDEAAFEAALTPGDRITFQPGSTSPAITEVLTLTNAPLEGQLYAINPFIDLYGVYADDDKTLLALVNYTTPGTPPLANHYYINGVERTLAQWEAEAPDVNVSADDLDDRILVEITAGNRNHRLTTTDPITP